MHSDIWLGDLAQALAAGVAQGRHELVADLLGLEAGAPRPATAGETEGAGRQPKSDSGHPAEEPPAAGPEPPATPQVTLTEELPLLAPLSTEPAPRRWAWPGSALDQPQPRHLAPRIPYRPLLAPRSSDVVLRTAVARWVRAGPVDIDALVQTLARQQPVRTLPRTPVATLRFGVQVLVDLGRGMEPFITDRRAVLRQLRDVTGRDGLAVRYFRYAPLRGISQTGHGRPAAYLPPPPGTHVLLLSDLGLGGPADDVRRSTRAEWESFSHYLRHHGCQATALVPLPPHRWPGWLVKLFPLISWDRHTTAGAATRQVRRR